MTRYAFWRVVAVVATILVAVVSLTPNTDAIDQPMGWTAWIASFVLSDVTAADKIAHAIAYAALGFLWTLGFTRGVRSIGLVFVGLVAYGAALEVGQAMGGVRMGDIGDLIANTVGTFAGIVTALIATFLFRR